MPYKNREKQKQYARQWIAKRRNKWLSENGPCRYCGSKDNLCVHHTNPNKKESHSVWSWNKERRLKELSKCIVLCEKCHNELHAVERRKQGPPGTSWCRTCRQFLGVKCFTKDKKTWDGYDGQCKVCKSKRRKKYYADVAQVGRATLL